MSSFPTLLLMTTLFRMSLNVSSTRNILLTGYAGNVVETFGQFVGGGNLVIGIIIFMILVIVQFVVINKVQSVYLKLLPGLHWMLCQVSRWLLTHDLNTGAIDDEEQKKT